MIGATDIVDVATESHVSGVGALEAVITNFDSTGLGPRNGHWLFGLPMAPISASSFCAPYALISPSPTTSSNHVAIKAAFSPMSS